MNRRFAVFAVLNAAILAPGTALAHHVMGGKLPSTLMSGLLSGLGHPVIGLDHLAAVLAAGFIASAHPAGPLLVAGYVIAMMTGVAVHVGGASLPFAEVLVALTVMALGAVMIWRKNTATPAALALFVVVGLIHGYALGESIFGAEQTPLFAYLAGLAVIQMAIAGAAMWAGRAALKREAEPVALRLIGAGIAGIGFAILVQQVVPAV